MTCSPLQRIDLHPDRLRRQGGLQVQHLTRLEVVGDAADLPHGLIVCPKKTNGCHDIAIRTVRAIQHGAVPGASPRRIGKHLVATQNNILVGVGGGKAIEDQKRHPHEHTQPYPSRNDPCTPDDPRCELGLSTTRTGGHQTEIRSHILTLDVDTYVGAGQFQGAGQSEWWITSSGCRCANAMLRASSTHSVRRCEAIAQPTTRRLPASMTTARYRKALATGTSAPPDPTENGRSRQDGVPARKYHLLRVHQTHDNSPCTSYPLWKVRGVVIRRHGARQLLHHQGQFIIIGRANLSFARRFNTANTPLNILNYMR